MKRKYDTNGVCIWKNSTSLTPVGLTTIFDMDNTATDTFPFHAVENQTDILFARYHDLPEDILVDARFGKSGYVVDPVFSPLVAPLIMAKRGLKFPYKPHQIVDSLIVPYLRMLVERDQECKAFAGQEEAFAAIGAEFPDSFICVDTNSPTLMAAIRLRNNKLLQHINGLVGIRPECPPEAVNGPYAEAARFINRWMESQWNDTVDVRHLKLLGGVPDGKAKPNPLGASVILANVKARSNSLIIDFDDSPGTGGLVAQSLRSSYSRIAYVQAKIGYHGPDVAGVQIDGTATSTADYIKFCRQFAKRKAAA